MSHDQTPEPTELIYQPKSSWQPLFLAASIAGIIVGLFAGSVYLVAGLIVGVFTILAWLRDTREDVVRMPRRQRTTTAVLPATPLRARRRR